MSYKALCDMAPGMWYMAPYVIWLSGFISYKATLEVSAPISLDFLLFLKYIRYRTFSPKSLLASWPLYLESFFSKPLCELLPDFNYILEREYLSLFLLSYYPTLFFFTFSADILYLTIYLFYYCLPYKIVNNQKTYISYQGLSQSTHRKNNTAIRSWKWELTICLVH